MEAVPPDEHFRSNTLLFLPIAPLDVPYNCDNSQCSNAPAKDNTEPDATKITHKFISSTVEQPHTDRHSVYNSPNINGRVKPLAGL